MKETKKSFAYWLEVAAIGIVLGLILQGAKAWTEPTEAPPNGNVGAPINTGGNFQWKGLGSSGGWLGLTGGLETATLKIHGSTRPHGLIMPGDVLTAQPNPADPTKSDGIVAWAAPPTGGTTGGPDIEGFCEERYGGNNCYFCREGQTQGAGMPCPGVTYADESGPITGSSAPAVCGDNGYCSCVAGKLVVTRNDWLGQPIPAGFIQYGCQK
jgi:hypothetical protein